MLTNKKDCTGCSVCSIVCTHNALIMRSDEHGSLYPVVDTSKCVNCGLCDKVCHIQSSHSTNTRTPRVYAAYLKNTDALSSVSSGGAFSAMAEAVIEAGGVVYGAAHVSLYCVKHIRVSCIDDLRCIKMSKYLESSLEDAFPKVKADLEAGVKVLFSGTPCQNAGLLTYLGKRNEGLTTCEVVCHGVPIWGVFKRYIYELESSYGSSVRSICYRDKSAGWNQNHIRIDFMDGTYISEKSNENRLHYAYCTGLFYRPSCSSCRYATLPRIADITLADYWLYNGELKKKNENRGISLVLCNNAKGEELFRAGCVKLVWEPSELKLALKSSRHLTHRPESSRYAEAFVHDAAFGYNVAYDKYMQKIVRDQRLRRVVLLPLLVAKKLVFTVIKRCNI